jgi:DNA-binding transcriptional LysR family regulator
VDRITVMKSFVAVAKAESFSAAARSQGVSGSLISRHISDLEQQLGVRLVNRTARSVSLTQQGQRYFDFSQHLLEELDREDAAIRGQQERAEGVLSVVSPKWIGSLDLASAIAEFARAYPQIEVHFDVGGMADRTYDFLDQGYDLAFHTRDLRDSSVRVRKVATLPFVLCASPDYLMRSPVLRDPGDLTEHACLMHNINPVWHFRRGEHVQHHKVTHSAFSSNTYLILAQAAIEGLGVALLPLRSVLGDLRDGRLETVLPEYAVPSRPLYIIYPPGLQSVKKFRVFLDFMGEWFKTQPQGADFEAPDVLEESPVPA